MIFPFRYTRFVGGRQYNVSAVPFFAFEAQKALCLDNQTNVDYINQRKEQKNKKQKDILNKNFTLTNKKKLDKKYIFYNFYPILFFSSVNCVFS